MQSTRWQNRVPRALVIPSVFALGAVAALGLRGQAGQQANNPPVQPPAQALNIQGAFEQVADHLRPSVVFIKSRQNIKTPTGFRRGAQDGGDSLPFNFPGFPGGQGGGRQFRVMPPSMPRRAEASGSGVIIRSDGYILTNDHVVADADRVTVRLQNGREYVGQVKRDFKSDLALIKIEANGLPAAEMADSDKVKIGQWAIAFGSPFGLSDTMTVGIVSSLHRQEAIGQGTDGRFYSSLIQTDASINPGNSGGPLVDIYGRIVGINVAIESPSGTNAGIGFAIPANTAKYIVDQLITKGSVTRGYLGLAPATPTYEEKQRYGVEQGALVKMVDDNTPAQKAGFQVGDVIVRYNNQPIADDITFRDMVSRTRPGDSATVIVKRDGHEQTLRPVIGAAPEQKVAAQEVPAVKEAAKGKLGVQIADAKDPQVRQELNLKDSVPNGAVIVSVTPGSPASEAGLQPGDVIVRLNNRPVADASQLAEAANGLKDGSSVSAVIRRGGQTMLAQINLE